MQIKLSKIRRFLASALLILLVATTTACSSGATATAPNTNLNRTEAYTQLERGNSVLGQNFGDWVVSTSKGLVNDAYVLDNNKLGVVISPKVKPTEVKTLAKALTIGFQKNFPNQDLTILVFAPDKHKILTAKYDVQTNNIEYKA